MYKIPISIYDFLYNSSSNNKKLKLMNYQEIISNYFVSSDKKFLLLYMEVGTGKTLTSLACGISGIETKKFKNIVILSPKVIQDEFIINLRMLCDMKNIKEFPLNDIVYLLAYNSNDSSEQFFELNKQINLNNSLFIIDEAHLFFKSVVKANIPVKKINNKSDEKYKEENNIGNCKKIYDKIKSFKNSYLICLTGTPSAKFPFETVPMFNFIGNIFPEDINVFNKKFINGNKIINENYIKNKLNGYICYVNADSSKQNLKVSPLKEINVEMSYPQYKQYLIDYAKELEEKNYTPNMNIYGMGFGSISSFHTKTFQDSIYYYPRKSNIDKIYSEEDKNIRNEYIKITKENCPKLIKMYEDSIEYKLCVFYLHFTDIYGAKSMSVLLENEGFTLAKPSEEIFNKKDKRYILFTGEYTLKTRNKWKRLFNDKRNINGEYIKYLILSPSGSVGLTLRNVRALFIGSVEFSYSTIRQILGRVNRLNSHINLPEDERKLDNFIYITTKNKKYYKEHTKEVNKLCSRLAPNYDEIAPTIERCIYQDSLIDDILCEDFRRILRECSIKTK